jgi:hypothetical protein
MSFVAIQIPASDSPQVHTAAAQQGHAVPGPVVCGNGIGQEGERVERALKAQLSVDELSGTEQDAYFDKLEDAMWNPTEAERAAFAKVAMKPGAVGLEDNDRSVVVPTTSS